MLFHMCNTQLKESATLLLYLHFLLKEKVAIFLVLGLYFLCITLQFYYDDGGI